MVHNGLQSPSCPQDRLEISFILSEWINRLVGFGKDGHWQHDYNQDGLEVSPKEWIEEVNNDMSVFINLNGVVKNHTGQIERCPIVYVCDTINNSNIEQKSKKVRILRIHKNEILSSRPPYDTYKPFLIHDNLEEEK